jgi:hypothetical protein
MRGLGAPEPMEAAEKLLLLVSRPMCDLVEGVVDSTALTGRCLGAPEP